MSNSERHEATASFWKFLYGLHHRDDRGPLARLRRGVNDPAADADVWATVGRYLPPGLRLQEERLYLLAACLFAMHPERKGASWSFGATLLKLRGKLNAGQDSLDQRFAGLLRSDREDLPPRLRHIIRMLASNEVPVNYEGLLSDLLRWDDDDSRVQQKWAHDYWSPGTASPEEGSRDGASEERGATGDEVQGSAAADRAAGEEMTIDY